MSARNWKCSECPSSFKTKGHLTNHMVRHTGERRYACHLCPQRFAHKTSLTLHLRWHRGEPRAALPTDGTLPALGQNVQCDVISTLRRLLVNGNLKMRGSSLMHLVEFCLNYQKQLRRFR